MTENNCFIRITKYSLKEKLKKLKIRNKHQDAICDIVKSNIMQYLDDRVQEASEEYWQIKGNGNLKDFIASNTREIQHE